MFNCNIFVLVFLSISFMKNSFFVLALIIQFTLVSQTEKPQKKTWFRKKRPSAPVWVANKGPYNGEATKAFDLIHTRLEVSFDWTKRQLLGKALIKLKPHFYNQDTLVLDAKGFDINWIHVTTKADFYHAGYTYDQKQIKIKLDKTLTSKDTFTVVVHYRANPENLPKSGSGAITEDKGLYFINHDGADSTKPQQIWTQGETESSSCWFPTIDKPNQKTTQEILITVPNKYTTLSNGILEQSTPNNDGTRTDYWVHKQPHAPYLFMMAIGEFDVFKDKWENIEVNYLMEKAYSPYAKKIFGNTPEMLGFFSSKLGVKYPWPKYSQVVVRDFVSGAMENTSASLFYEGLNVTDRQLLDRNWDNIIAHELFHHWFGDLVTCESWSNLPLNESFANYSEYLWNEHKYGKDEADYHLYNEMDEYIDESKEKQEPLIRYHYFDKEDMFDNHSYNKGGCTLHMLRNLLGDDAFFASLKNYLTKNAYKPAEIEHLRLAFEEVTGQDLHWFFDQFFMKPGHMQLGVTQSYANGKLKLMIAQMQDSLYTPVYKLPLQIEIWSQGKSEIKTVNIQKNLEIFEFELSSKPELVVVDANQILLGEIHHTKSVQEYIYQYTHCKPYRSRLIAALNLAEKAQIDSLAAKAMYAVIKDPHFSIREIALSILQGSKYIPKDSLKSICLKLAQTDKTPKIRAIALKALAPFADNYMELISKSLTDSAYSVVGAALHSYLASKSTTKSEVLNQYKSVQMLPILISISDFYTKQKDTTQQAWFDYNIGVLQRREQYYFINQYVKYYTVLGKLNSIKVINALQKIVESKTGFIWSKLNAFKQLAEIKNFKERKELLTKIYNQENNTKLKKEYESILKKL